MARILIPLRAVFLMCFTFIYAERVSQTYSYHGTVSVLLPPQGTARRLITECTVKISPISNAKSSMKVTGCSFNNSNSEDTAESSELFSYLRHEMSRHDVIFMTSQSGDILTHPAEAAMVLNMKRSILSLMSSAPSTNHVGVTIQQKTHRGDCSANISKTEDNSIQADIDLKTCSHAYCMTKSLVPFLQTSVVQDPISGVEKCLYKRQKNGRVQQVRCEEQLSVNTASLETALQVNTRRSLTLMTSTSATPEVRSFSRYIRSSLNIPPSKPQMQQGAADTAVQKAISDLLELSNATTDPTSAQTTSYFRRLRARLVTMERDALMRLVAEVLGSGSYNDVTEGLMVDALASCETQTCVTVVMTSSIPVRHRVRFLRSLAVTCTPCQRSLSVLKEACTSPELAESCKVPLDILRSRYLSSLQEIQQDTTTYAAKSILGEILRSSEAPSGYWAHYLPLVSGSVTTAVGIPINFTIDSVMLLTADVSGTETGGATGKLAKLGLIGDIVASISFGWESEQTGIQKSTAWTAQLTVPLTPTTSSNDMTVQLGKLKLASPVQTKTITYVNTNGDLKEVPVASNWCLWRPLDWLTGTNLCRSHSNSNYPDVWSSELRKGLQGLLADRSSSAGQDNGGKQFASKHLPINSRIPTRKARSVLTAWDGVAPTYTAMVMGQNHIVTWDGTAYSLPEYRTRRCVYQLARDTKRHNFTLLQTRHMVELLTSDVAVRVRHDGRVLIDRGSKPSDLPYRSRNGHVIVTRRASSIQVTTTFGVRLQYDTKTQNTLFTLSYGYHDHSRGLMGVNDGLRHRGYVTRQENVTHSVYDLVTSFEISNRPECHPEVNSPEVRQSPALCDNGLDDRCDALFTHRTSPLSACFGRVNPTSFKTMCLQDVRRCYGEMSPASESAASSICKVASAYRDVCAAKGVGVHTPDTCGQCGHHTVGHSWTQHTHHKIDVVIVTSADVSSNVNHVTDVLNRAYRTGSNPYDLRIGVVTTDGAQTHSLTFNGHLFTQTPHDIASISSRLSLSQTSFRLSSQSEGSVESHDLEEGMHLAAEYPYRPQAVKVVILLPEDDSVQDDTSSLVDVLTSRGIIINTISSYELLRSKKVLGLLQTGELLTTDGNLANAQLPQTRYAQVALQSGGVLLHPEAVSGSRRTTRHLVSKVFSSQAARQSAMCRRCTCVGGQDGGSVCRIVEC